MPSRVVNSSLTRLQFSQCIRVNFASSPRARRGHQRPAKVRPGALINRLCQATNQTRHLFRVVIRVSASIASRRVSRRQNRTDTDGPAQRSSARGSTMKYRLSQVQATQVIDAVSWASGSIFRTIATHLSIKERQQMPER